MSPARESTLCLVESLRRRDAEGAKLLHAYYHNALTRFCWGYLGDMQEAEDAVQEITIKVLQAPQIPDLFRPWIYKIARNHCLNLLRDVGRRRESAPSHPSQIDAALTGQLSGMVRDEMRDRVRQLVASLSEEQQEVLRLRYVEGLSRAEIRDVLDISETLVKSRIFEGLKKLRLSAADLRGE